MIGFLKGIVEIRNDPYIYIDVSGVGYKVLASGEVLSHIKNTGEKIKVFTYTHVREDILELYGFATREDLKVFESLIGVSGVGPKTAMSIFATKSRGEIVQAIINSDVDFFTSVPRLGKKNAQKIIIELKSKFGSVADLDLSEKETKDQGDVLIALKSLGFTSEEVRQVLREVPQDLSVEEKIKQVLRKIGK